jgi:hypothetical protein
MAMITDPGRFNRLMALQVDDQGSYAEYRARMTPLLHASGGAFGVDLEVARVLKAPEEGTSAESLALDFQAAPPVPRSSSTRRISRCALGTSSLRSVASQRSPNGASEAEPELVVRCQEHWR